MFLLSVCCLLTTGLLQLVYNGVICRFLSDVVHKFCPQIITVDCLISVVRWWERLAIFLLNSVKANHILYHMLNFTIISNIIYRVTTCLENLEMSGILTAVREISGK